jgi:ElaB/YqjD/DUF883 family membrane-anchored ribosome-binding protein
VESASKDKLIDDLRAVAADLEELLRATAQQAGERADAARARAEESLRAARMRLEAAGLEMAERTRDAAREADRYVRDNPWQAVGLAAGIGLIAGILLARR